MKYATGYWGHFLPSTRHVESVIRLVVSLADQQLVASEVSQGTLAGEPVDWRPLTGAESADLLDSLVNANGEMFGNPGDYGLEATDNMPRWAWRSIEHSKSRTRESDPSLN
jgi:hypothetical protein